MHSASLAVKIPSSSLIISSLKDETSEQLLAHTILANNHSTAYSKVLQAHGQYFQIVFDSMTPRNARQACL